MKRWMPLIIIGVILLIVFATFSGRYNSLVGLQEARERFSSYLSVEST